MRFLLDENVHRGLIVFLQENRHEAIRVPAGISNGEVIAFAVREERILITHDADFSLDAPSFGHPGIILLRIPPRDFEDLKRSLTKLLSEKNPPNDLANRLFLLFKDRYDDFPFKAEEFHL